MAVDTETGEARHHLRQLRSLGHWEQGHAYYSGLLLDLQLNVQVAIEAAQLYLVQGHYRRAWNVCERVLSDFTMPAATEVRSLSEDHGAELCLKLLFSYVAISRHGRIRTAFKLVEPLLDGHLNVSIPFTEERVQDVDFTSGQSPSSEGSPAVVPTQEDRSQQEGSSATDDPSYGHCKNCKAVSEVIVSESQRLPLTVY